MKNNKLVLITGAGGILGRETAWKLAAEGFNLVLVDINASNINHLSEQIKKNFNVEVITSITDITSKHQLNELKHSVEKCLGEVDVLINNAATKSENFFKPFEEYDLNDWNHVLNVNSTAAMLCCQVFGSIMAQRGSGIIVNVLSIYGIVAPDQSIYKGSEYLGQPINTPAIYSVSKAALLGLTKYLSTYWAKKGVRVNAVTPGGIYSGQNDVFVENYSKKVPMNRMANAEEIANGIVFLASDKSSYINGHNLIIDGGLTVW